MIQITQLQADQVHAVKRLIYTVAHHTFDQYETLEAMIADCQVNWPLADIDNFEERYCASGTFLVMWDDDQMIGTGALHRLEAGVGEIKRVWLLPAYQGRGLGYRMMMELMAAARQWGYTTVRLETSPKFNVRAYVFYHQLGFYDIPRYGDDVDDVGMEMMLTQVKE